MTNAEIIGFLTGYNAWRRDDGDEKEGITMPHPRAIGEAIDAAIAAIRELEADKRRLDWLSDRNNTLGQVLLPTSCVVENPTDMRAAIDMAMGLSCAEKEASQ